MGHRSEVSAFTGMTSLDALGANVLLVHGLHTLGSLSWNIPSWSISCEFAVYILFGLLALGGMLSWRLCVFVITPVCIALYCALALSVGTLDVSYDWGLVRAIGGFFLAPLLIVLGRGAPAPSTALGLAEIAVAAGAIAIMAVATGAMVVLVIPLLFLAVCLLQTDKGPVARILQSAAIQYLGRISYSIYMVQMVVLLAAATTLKRVFKVVDWSTIDPWIGDVMVLAIAGVVVAAASVTFRLIEEPGRALGRRLAARSIKAEGTGPLTSHPDLGATIPFSDEFGFVIEC
jgi:peptidoglycan/LPS O-acetylase OafA/YrhL